VCRIAVVLLEEPLGKEVLLLWQQIIENPNSMYVQPYRAQNVRTNMYVTARDINSSLLHTHIPSRYHRTLEHLEPVRDFFSVNNFDMKVGDFDSDGLFPLTIHNILGPDRLFPVRFDSSFPSSLYLSSLFLTFVSSCYRYKYRISLMMFSSMHCNIPFFQ
jgi:hypothetical protein